MKWSGDIGLELYIANSTFPSEDQFKESQNLLETIQYAGVIERLDIVGLKSIQEFREQQDYFDMINDSYSESKLPFLVAAYACETGAVIGYTGLEDITKQLSLLHILPKNTFLSDKNPAEEICQNQQLNI